MKTFWVGVLLIGGLVAAQAEPGGVRVMTNGAAAPLVVMPISVQEEEPRVAPRLRDVLRQPYDDQPELGSKPYRLSAEERFRLREQLRTQADASHTKDKP